MCQQSNVISADSDHASSTSLMIFISSLQYENGAQDCVLIRDDAHAALMMSTKLSQSHAPSSNSRFNSSSSNNRDICPPKQPLYCKSPLPTTRTSPFFHLSHSQIETIRNVPCPSRDSSPTYPKRRTSMDLDKS